MTDWRLIPASLGFREFNDCHKPGGAPDGGQFCSNETDHEGIGMIVGGRVDVIDLKDLEDPDLAGTHRDVYSSMVAPMLGVSASKRFRYNYGEVVWDDTPSDDDLFAVENEFESMGWHVKDHVLMQGGRIPRPRPH